MSRETCASFADSLPPPRQHAEQYPHTGHTHNATRYATITHRHATTRTHTHGTRTHRHTWGYACPPPLMYICRCVCRCVVLWSGTFLGLEKNGKKRGMSVSVLVIVVDKRAYASASGQTYVRQVLPPTVYSFELVAVSHCFSRHHV